MGPYKNIQQWTTDAKPTMYLLYFHSRVARIATQNLSFTTNSTACILSLTHTTRATHSTTRVHWLPHIALIQSRSIQYDEQRVQSKREFSVSNQLSSRTRQEKRRFDYWQSIMPDLDPPTLGDTEVWRRRRGQELILTLPYLSSLKFSGRLFRGILS